jgi:hypothetical protein
MAKRHHSSHPHHASKHVKQSSPHGYHSDSAVEGMSREFASGKRGEMDEMVESNDGLFPERVVMRDFPASDYGSGHEPYDGLRGVDEQIDDDSAILQRRKTRGSF